MRLSTRLILSTLVLVAGISTGFAGSVSPVTTGDGNVVYKQSFKLTAAFKEEDAYDLLQAWLTQSPAKFTSQNTQATGAGGPSKNRTEIEQAYYNPMPLQTLDPESKRVMGKGVIKYYGGSNSGINVLYLEYYVVLQVKGSEITATINQIKYHHFGRNYTATPIYSWQGGRPLDSADNLGKLLEANTPDAGKAGAFINEDIAKLFTDLQHTLEAKNALVRR